MIITKHPCDNILCSCQYNIKSGSFVCAAPHLINYDMIKSRSQLHEIIDLSLPGVEVGVASGVFSLEILRWGIKKLYMVDVWEQIPGLKGMAGDERTNHTQNYKDAAERVKDLPGVLLKGLSTEMAKQIPDNSLGFVYLDACHEEDDVFQDLQTWVPKLVYGGVLAMHDFGDQNYGVKRAAMKFCNGKYKIHVLKEDGRIENMGAYFINK